MPHTEAHDIPAQAPLEQRCLRWTRVRAFRKKVQRTSEKHSDDLRTAQMSWGWPALHTYLNPILFSGVSRRKLMICTQVRTVQQQRLLACDWRFCAGRGSSMPTWPASNKIHEFTVSLFPYLFYLPPSPWLRPGDYKLWSRKTVNYEDRHSQLTAQTAQSKSNDSHCVGNLRCWHWRNTSLAETSTHIILKGCTRKGKLLE